MVFRIICFEINRREVGDLPFISKTDTETEPTSLTWDLARCQTQTDIKPRAIYVKSYLSCVPIHSRHMNIQLHLNFSSRALLKSCHLALSVAVWGQNTFYYDRFFFCMGASDHYQIDSACKKKTGVAWIPGWKLSDLDWSVRPISNRYRYKLKLLLLGFLRGSSQDCLYVLQIRFSG